MSNVELKVIEHPRYGRHYRRGYVGFTYHSDHIFAKGTVWFTRWERMSDIKVSHALLVSGRDECIEAVGTGVRRHNLHEYFDDEHCQIFFRKPRSWSPNMARRMINRAVKEIGKAYDSSLIISDALIGSFAGHLLNRITRNKLEEFLSEALNHDDRWICSELVAYCLDSQPELHDRGILAQPNAAITPQELFEDNEIFEPWKREPA